MFQISPIFRPKMPRLFLPLIVFLAMPVLLVVAEQQEQLVLDQNQEQLNHGHFRLVKVGGHLRQKKLRNIHSTQLSVIKKTNPIVVISDPENFFRAELDRKYICQTCEEFYVICSEFQQKIEIINFVEKKDNLEYFIFC